MRNEISANAILDAVVKGILASGTELVIDGSFYAEIAPLVESETLHAQGPEALVGKHASSLPSSSVLDFGCGTGGHRNLLEAAGLSWTGLNYKEGMATEAAQSAFNANDANIHFYNGVDIPFEDEIFGMVYSFQTFEHIQDIGRTFSEIKRVLKPGGRLVGAVSYLEQSHDYSTFNFTPYGFKMACHRAGLLLEKLYPRSDVFTFLLRRLLVVTSASDENSLTHSAKADNIIGEALGKYAQNYGDITRANLLRLMFSAHFAFDVMKPLGVAA